MVLSLAEGSAIHDSGGGAGSEGMLLGGKGEGGHPPTRSWGLASGAPAGPALVSQAGGPAPSTQVHTPPCFIPKPQ